MTLKAGTLGGDGLTPDSMAAEIERALNDLVKPAANEDPSDVSARVRYERAVRADFDGRREDAVREAQACIAAQPDGRFASASRSLIGRLNGVETAAVRSTGVGPRTELVISSTLTGLYLSSLVASATDAGQKGFVAWLMLGTGGALVGSIFATADRHVPQSMPQMLQNGVGYGTWASLMVQSISNNLSSSGSSISGGVAAGATAGAVAGLAVSPYLTWYWSEFLRFRTEYQVVNVAKIG